MIRENRNAEKNSTRRIALVDLALDGLLVESIGPNEYIRVTVYKADGSVHLPSTNLVWQKIYTSDDQTELWGWSLLFTTPNQSGKLTVRYEVKVAECYEFWTDTINVI